MRAYCPPARRPPIGVFPGVVGNDLSTRDRRSAGVLNQAMHPSLHLTGSANGEPKAQGNHRDRSRVNAGERNHCRFSHIVATCRSGPGWFVDYSERGSKMAFRKVCQFTRRTPAAALEGKPIDTNGPSESPPRRRQRPSKFPDSGPAQAQTRGAGSIAGLSTMWCGRPEATPSWGPGARTARFLRPVVQESVNPSAARRPGGAVPATRKRCTARCPAAS
jgi:hypothetical protein